MSSNSNFNYKKIFRKQFASLRKETFDCIVYKREQIVMLARKKLSLLYDRGKAVLFVKQLN